MPSPYVKKGYGEVSKKAEDRIREDVIVKCKVCNGIMTFHGAYTGIISHDAPKHNYYHCAICLRNVLLTQL